MKTTCLIPIPVSEWMQRNPKSSYYNGITKSGQAIRFWYWADTGKCIPSLDEGKEITHVLVPQSGYFFTEEEMKRILSVVSSEEKLQQFAKSLDLDFTKLSNEALAWRTCFEYVTQLILKP